MRIATLAVAALVLMTALPTAEAQVPPPPTPPTWQVACPAIGFPILDWAQCMMNPPTTEYLVWSKAMTYWLRCDILGGAAC